MTEAEPTATIPDPSVDDLLALGYRSRQQQPDGTWKINGVYLEQPTNA